MKQITEFTKPLDLMYFLSHCENINGVNYIAKDDFLSHVKELREHNETLKERNRILENEMQNFIDNVIADKRLYDNQITYFKGRFNKAIKTNQ